MALKMRVLILLFFASCISAKINMKALTESLGQEVIEIGAPIKELPPDIEEEPSAENEGDKITSDFKVATPKEKVLKKSDPTKKTKDIDNIYRKKQEQEEERIEKELSDIYKDSIDYKSESAEATYKENTTEVVEKPIERTRTNFQFQPNSNKADDVERFRTSVDEIDCNRNKLAGVKPESLIKRTVDEVISIETEPDQDKDDHYEWSSANGTDLIENDTVKVKKGRRITTKKRGYWFGPDSPNRRDLDNFRTSQDYFRCDNMKLTSYEPSTPKSGSNELFEDVTFLNLFLFFFNFIYVT